MTSFAITPLTEHTGAEVPGTTSLMLRKMKDVDGRDKPGHDVSRIKALCRD